MDILTKNQISFIVIGLGLFIFVAFGIIALAHVFGYRTYMGLPKITQYCYEILKNSTGIEPNQTSIDNCVFEIVNELPNLNVTESEALKGLIK
jgi:hypothetical protein